MMRALAWLLFPALGGCFFLDIVTPIVASSWSGWYDVGTVKKPREEITRITRDEVVRQGYVIPSYDPRAGRIETDWNVQLSSHWREGHRTKLEAEFLPAAEGATIVRVRSAREYNENARQPMLLEKADWTGASVDDKQAEKIPEPAIRLRQQLKLKFFGLSND